MLFEIRTRARIFELLIGILAPVVHLRWEVEEVEGGDPPMVDEEKGGNQFFIKKTIKNTECD